MLSNDLRTFLDRYDSKMVATMSAAELKALSILTAVSAILTEGHSADYELNALSDKAAECSQIAIARLRDMLN